MHAPMQFSTRRFVLRDFTDQDAPAFAAYHADPRSSVLYGPNEGGPEHATELVQLFRAWAQDRPRSRFQFAVVLGNGNLIGCGGLRVDDTAAEVAEVGIELDPTYWGRFGYAVEIATALLDFGFADLKLGHVVGRTVDANVRIARLAEAFGAKSMEADTPDWMAARGWHRVDWHLTRERWLAEASKRPGMRRDPALRYRRRVADA